MLQMTDRINGGILWANLHLLFWLSLVPFATGWMGENHYAPLPTAVYGVVLLLAGIGVFHPREGDHRGPGSGVAAGSSGRERHEGQVSVVLYAIAIPLAFVHQAIADAIYVFVALIWLVPDRRIEGQLK